MRGSSRVGGAHARYWVGLTEEGSAGGAAAAGPGAALLADSEPPVGTGTGEAASERVSSAALLTRVVLGARVGDSGAAGVGRARLDPARAGLRAGTRSVTRSTDVAVRTTSRTRQRVHGLELNSSRRLTAGRRRKVRSLSTRVVVLSCARTMTGRRATKWARTPASVFSRATTLTPVRPCGDAARAPDVPHAKERARSAKERRSMAIASAASVPAACARFRSRHTFQQAMRQRRSFELRSRSEPAAAGRRLGR